MNGSIDAKTGEVRAGDLVIGLPGLTRNEFEHQAKVRLEGKATAPGFVTFGPLEVMMDGKKFVGGVRFKEAVIHGLTFTWKDGRVARLGYDADEKDLLGEKKVLTAMLGRLLGASATDSSLGADVFEFSWGAVVSRADLKSTWCGIEVRYV